MIILQFSSNIKIKNKKQYHIRKKKKGVILFEYKF